MIETHDECGGKGRYKVTWHHQLAENDDDGAKTSVATTSKLSFCFELSAVIMLHMMHMHP